MNNSKLYWIGYYFDQNCILHPETGRWTLAGFVDGHVYLKRYEGSPDEDCMSYPISEVQFILKKINPFLFDSVSDLQLFIRTKAMDGYWMEFCENINVIFEP